MHTVMIFTLSIVRVEWVNILKMQKVTSGSTVKHCVNIND